MFRDREDAAQHLSCALENEGISADMVVLTSLEAFPIGKKISSALDIPMKSLVSGDLKVPGRENLVFGAVSERGDIWIDDAMVEEFMIGKRYISGSRERKMRELNNRLEELDMAGKPELKSKDMIMVSHGISSGMKTAASLGSAISSGAGDRIVATPFVSETGLERLDRLISEIICLEKYRFILSADECYSSNNKIKKSEIKQYFKA